MLQTTGKRFDGSPFSREGAFRIALGTALRGTKKAGMTVSKKPAGALVVPPYQEGRL
jgi:hypothetical protein